MHTHEELGRTGMRAFRHPGHSQSPLNMSLSVPFHHAMHDAVMSSTDNLYPEESATRSYGLGQCKAGIALRVG